MSATISTEEERGSGRVNVALVPTEEGQEIEVSPVCGMCRHFKPFQNGDGACQKRTVYVEDWEMGMGMDRLVYWPAALVVGGDSKIAETCKHFDGEVPF